MYTNYDIIRTPPMTSHRVRKRFLPNSGKNPFSIEISREKQNNNNQSPQSLFIRVMEKSVKNAVFKGFPVLMESGPLGSKQYSQTTNEEKNNFLSSYFKVYYLVSKCTGKRVADRSAIDTALGLARNQDSGSSILIFFFW